MLERPNIQDSQIIACLRNDYGLNVTHIDFLPLGADRNTAVFRTGSYFVKLRSGEFDEMTLIVPNILREHPAIIAPVATRSGQLWTNLDHFKVAVFPFIEGRDGYDAGMSDDHWIMLGHTLKTLHTAPIPMAIQRERYSNQWRERVRDFMVMVEGKGFTEPVAAEMAAFLKQKKAEIHDIVSRAEALAAALQTQSEPFVLCHADLHIWNVLIDTNKHLYVIDWDTLILAPKERDLMFIGGGLYGNQRPPEEEERLFYQGYGDTQVNLTALAYYRYERIVQDIVAYCEQLLLTDEGGADRANGLRQFTGQFRPGEVVDMAYRTRT